MLHKGGGGGLFINYPYFFLVNMINWSTVYSDRLKERGLRHGSGKKRGSYAGVRLEKKGGGGLRHGSG